MRKGSSLKIRYFTEESSSLKVEKANFQAVPQFGGTHFCEHLKGGIAVL